MSKSKEVVEIKKEISKLDFYNRLYIWGMVNTLLYFQRESKANTNISCIREKIKGDELP